METLKQFHGLPCNCYTRRVLLGLLPDPNADSCPTICGTDIEIVGISDNYTVDGWYLEFGASNLVYMESGVITQTVACPSGMANYGHPNGPNNGYEAPHLFSQGGEWFPMLEVDTKDNGGFNYDFTIYGADEYDYAGATTVVLYSTDGGATYVEGGTGGAPDDSGLVINVDTGTDSFIYQVVVTLANGCKLYNPAPPNLGSPVVYFILDDPFLGNFSGWTFNGTDLLDFRENILPNLPNWMYDASVVESGDSLYVVFSGVSIPNITVVDALSNPVDLDWVVLNSVIPCQTVTFTVVNPSDTYIQYLLIGSYVDPASLSLATFTDPDFISDFEAKLRADGYGSLATASISINGNDVTIGLANANGLTTGFRWLDSAMNTGDVTLTNC